MIDPISLSPDSLPPRPKDAHKGDFGHVLVIGGNNGMGGAVRLAAEAALRVGAGLVSVATRASHISALIAARPEIMAHGIEAATDISPLLKRATVILMGPGLGQDQWAQDLLHAGLAMQLPTIVDADALNLLAIQNNNLHQRNWILTPHPGEAARLLGSTVAAIQADRLAAARTLQQRYGGVVVLKGSGSIVQGSGSPQICMAGNPGMASGGMGDVLGGVIAGLLAQQFELEKAAALGTLVHSLAADRAAAEGGERGLLAMDLMPHLWKLVNNATS